MSASWGLVKFKKTGNIYYCCYEGTSDVTNPCLCTPEECWDPNWEAYCAISYCRTISERLGERRMFPEDITDLDEVEIYSDYGGGFYWSGTGSESAKMLKGPLDPWDDPDHTHVKDGQPEWVKEYLRKETI